MANGIREYRLGSARLARGLLEGFTLETGGVLRTAGDVQQRSIFLAGLDSAQEDCPWGRLSFRADLQGDAVLTVRAYASNDFVVLQDGAPLPVDAFLLDSAEPPIRKAKLFAAAGGIKCVGSSDLLLYGQQGRYLWIWIELNGEGDGVLDRLRVLVPGDNFYRTFPALYQNGQPEDAFFHRYLSIFSSLYSDLQDTVDRLPAYLDLDTAPAEALPIFAQWLGLGRGGNFLPPGDLRRLLRLAPQLIAAKGTRRAIELVVGLFVEEPVYLVEHNLLNRNQLASDSLLYGDSPFDCTLLISRPSDELLRARLTFLIDQFKPLRCRVRLIFLGSQGRLDAFSYLDLNACLLQFSPGSLDDGSAQAGMTCLQ